MPESHWTYVLLAALGQRPGKSRSAVPGTSLGASLAGWGRGATRPDRKCWLEWREAQWRQTVVNTKPRAELGGMCENIPLLWFIAETNPMAQHGPSWL